MCIVRFLLECEGKSNLGISREAVTTCAHLLQWRRSGQENISSPPERLPCTRSSPGGEGELTLESGGGGVSVRKLGLDSLGPQDPLLALPVLKEALPLSASSSRRPTEQSRAPRHTQHPSRRRQRGALAGEAVFRGEHSGPRARLPSPKSVTIEQLLF